MVAFSFHKQIRDLIFLERVSIDALNSVDSLEDAPLKHTLTIIAELHVWDLIDRVVKALGAWLGDKEVAQGVFLLKRPLLAASDCLDRSDHGAFVPCRAQLLQSVQVYYVVVRFLCRHVGHRRHREETLRVDED